MTGLLLRSAGGARLAVVLSVVHCFAVVRYRLLSILPICDTTNFTVARAVNLYVVYDHSGDRTCMLYMIILVTVT